jgi:hypothetical protein
VPFVTPLALLGLLFIPAVVAMYLLKLRRDRAVVPSTLLWDRLVADVEANAPWQRLRRSLLLLLQLLLVIALALLAARPFVERPAGLARDLVVVIDASASMAATDVVPDRISVARQAAIDALRDLPAGGKVSVIAAGRTARVVANGTTDLGRVRQAIESIEAGEAAGHLDDALRLASALAARSGDAEILIATDAALATAATATTGAPIRVLHVGRERKNQAIVALSVRPAPSGVTRSVFTSVANLDLEAAERRLEVWGDGRLVDSRDLALDPQARLEVVIDDLPGDVAVVELRLTGGSSGPDGTGDQLATDDRAWAIVPPTRPREVLLVSEGDPYLETALSYLPDTALFGLVPSDYPEGAVRTDGTEWDLIIFQGTLPSELPRSPILAIAPPRTSALGTVTGVLEEPFIGVLDPDEPILRYVDLSTLHIAEAVGLVLPEWARPVIPGPGGAPLLYAGSRDGLPTAVLAFDPRRSDLPLQVAFPILLANLSGELFGGSSGPTEAVRPGDPVTLGIPAGASGLVVERPDGSTVELSPGVVGGAAVAFSQTEALGVYTVRPIADPDASPAPSSGPTQGAGTSPTPTPVATGTPAASGSPGVIPADPNAPVRFAVDLFDVDESNIAPGQPAAIEQLGAERPDPSAAPGSGGAVDDRPPARDELWGVLLLLVLGVILAEWVVYQRDGLTRIRRGLAERFGSAAASGSPPVDAGRGR